MQNEDRDGIRKTISEHREPIFAAMFNKHYTHAALYMKYNSISRLNASSGYLAV